MSRPEQELWAAIGELREALRAVTTRLQALETQKRWPLLEYLLSLPVIERWGKRILTVIASWLTTMVFPHAWEKLWALLQLLGRLFG